MILAGDIGGTKTVLALFEEASGRLMRVREETMASVGAPSFEALAGQFLDAAGRPACRAACFGVAGAVVEGRAKTTNLPWQLDERDLATALGIPRVRLLNDLEAAAYGVLALPAESVETLQPGAPPAGPATMALIAAGTGLGIALMPWDGTRHDVVASEGGHVDFAPRTDLEAELWAHLRERFGHVSYERILSGPGLVNVYRFLREARKAGGPGSLAGETAAGDPAAISAAALAGTDPVAVEALELFVAVYGAAAGNLALTAMAVSGVFVGGGIAPKILPALRAGRFLEAFGDKGRMARLTRAIPVRVVLEPRAPLVGAADRARAL